jgi:hypothetical protein
MIKYKIKERTVNTMATQTQVQSFIKTLSALAQAEVSKRKASGKKWSLPSICIAQAALETGWGTTSLMKNANAYFGIKAGKSWKGKVYSSRTKECYDGVNYTSITDTFRAYSSLRESVADYFDLITGSSRYAAACNVTNAKECITAIKKGGYSTSPTYIENVMSIVTKYKLTQYDSVVTSSKNKPVVENAQNATKKAVSTSVQYFKKYTGTNSSIVSALKALGYSNTSFAYRKKIAVANKITSNEASYTGTVTQNTKMINLLKKGKLIKP